MCKCGRHDYISGSSEKSGLPSLALNAGIKSCPRQKLMEEPEESLGPLAVLRVTSSQQSHLLTFVVSRVAFCIRTPPLHLMTSEYLMRQRSSIKMRRGGVHGANRRLPHASWLKIEGDSCPWVNRMQPDTTPFCVFCYKLYAYQVIDFQIVM